MGKTLSFITLIAFVFFYSCSNDEPNYSSELTIVNESSSNNAEATYTSLRIKGKITGETSNAITTRGICWSTNPNPTINSNILNLESNIINTFISNLTVNTTYYIRIFTTRNNQTTYGENIILSTLSLENSTWKFVTNYPEGPFSTGTTIESTVNFYNDNTTMFDEIGPGQGFFITYGSWSLNGNVLTYIWEGNNPNLSTYIYTGTLSGMTMQGTCTHPSTPGTWSATPLD